MSKTARPRLGPSKHPERTPQEELVVLAEATNFRAENLAVIDTTSLRQYRFVAKCTLRGMTLTEIYKAVQATFDVNANRAFVIVADVRKRARLANDDEDQKDIIVAEMTRAALQRHQLFHAEAVATVPDVPLTAQAVAQISRQRTEADKAARANAAFVLDVYGRTSAKWSPKTTIDQSPLQGGTVEQQNSVRKLLGLPPLIDVTPEPEGTP